MSLEDRSESTRLEIWWLKSLHRKLWLVDLAFGSYSCLHYHSIKWHKSEATYSVITQVEGRSGETDKSKLQVVVYSDPAKRPLANEHAVNHDSFPFMKLPYDIRRMIYKYFFPSKTNIHLTYGTIGEGYLRFAVPVISKNVLRVSRQIQQEAYQVLYGSNTFSINLEEDTYHGHVRDYPYRELHKQCHTVTDLFLRWMHSSTRLLIPELHLTLLGSEYPMVHLHQYLRGLADFQCVTITVLPKEWEMGDTKGAPWTPLWNYIGLIGAVRRVLGPHNNVTYWDDLGEVSSAANFQEILPDAIQRVTSIEDRTWWIAHKASL